MHGSFWKQLAVNESLHWVGGVGTLVVTGSFSTADLQVSPDGGTTWISLGNEGHFTSPGSCNFELPAKSLIRVTSSQSPVIFVADVGPIQRITS